MPDRGGVSVQGRGRPESARTVIEEAACEALAQAIEFERKAAEFRAFHRRLLAVAS